MGALDDKVAIVTGAGGGFGESYAACLTGAGAAVVMSDINTENVEAAAARVGAGGATVLPIAADVTDPASWASLVATTVSELGGVDILVNNAGLMSEIPMDVPFSKLELEWWDRVLRVNLTGPFLGIQAVVPEMKKRGGGRIVNQSSGGAFGPSGVYGVSKLGLISLTVSMAHELAHAKITVNAIAPGFTNTPAAMRSLPAGMEDMADQIAPLGGGTPEDVHGALLLLTSPAGRWITGQTLNVDGGWVMRI